MDLNAPLGKSKPTRHSRRVARATMLLAGLGILGGVTFFFWTADPRGDQPYAVATIPAPVAPQSAPQQPATDQTPTGSINTAGDDLVRIEHGVKVVSPMPARTGQSSAGPAVIDVSRAVDESARRGTAAKPASSSDQTLAKAEDTPPVAAPVDAGAKPRVAIFISGMGLDASATRTATEIMPGAVDLAFLPGPSDPSQAVAAARARGHEILLQLPMQTNAGVPGTPHMLRSDESPTELAADLAWMMRRFDGYAGVANLLGAPVMSRQDTMAAILTTIGKRGLFFVDDGTSRESGAAALSARLGVRAVRADVVIDATGNPAVVKANLARLADIARSKGTAVGMASGLPDHMAAIASFANDARSQGLDLVPISVILANAAHVATSR